QIKRKNDKKHDAFRNYPSLVCLLFFLFSTQGRALVYKTSIPAALFFARLLGMKTDCPVENCPLSAANYFQLIFPTVDDWRCHENNNLL
ncbi:hypothetical protein, partial [Citrobacter freundii]